MNTASPEFAHVIALVAAAAGGFFGSGSAFMLERSRRRDEDIESKYQKLFTTQYTLITQHNTLLILKTRYLDQYRNDPDRTMKLLPTVFYPSELRVNIADIAFLANNDCADTLNNIYIAQNCYLNSIAALTLRNNKVQELQDDPTVNLQEFDQHTGRGKIQVDPRKIKLIDTITNGLYESVDDTEAKLASIVPELRTTIKKLFPKKKALSYVPDPKGGEQPGGGYSSPSGRSSKPTP